MENNINQSQNSSDSFNRQLVQELTTACEGLLWFSEAEYPFQVIYWHDLESWNLDILLEQENVTADTKVKVQDLLTFFNSAITEQEWHNELEQAEVKRYQALINVLDTNLQNIQVYLLGETEIDVYILGTVNENALAGLKTKVVAT
ncbi:nuclease A inhibitor family protein [Pleurocapsa sp. FMAR1]|uniref:nuclease A inhibitor family protein n=1 Tax=Pleurocapsa sp. FMAR1 TaxID=3040204 RepID=UPI0029C8DFA9|nr:nuclease A inhibitor family protein [Pleurocapsa sp. FMAR1]